jgi:hypothetical protein
MHGGGFWGSLTIVTEQVAPLLYLSIINFRLMRDPPTPTLRRGKEASRPTDSRLHYLRRARQVRDQRSELPGPFR